MLSHERLHRAETSRPAALGRGSLTLLDGFGEIFGLQEEPDLSLVLRNPYSRSIFVVGKPIENAIEPQLRRMGAAAR
jgi:hypothetical protein